MSKKTTRFSKIYYEGPIEAKDYEPFGYKLNGENLPPLAEEMLYSAAKYIEDEHYWKRLVDCKNFIQCLKPELLANQKSLNWPNDFIPLLKKMKEDQKVRSEEKKAKRTPEVKAKEKEEKVKLKEKYGFAIVDGEKIPIDNYLMEGSSILMTRGEDPRFGTWKYKPRLEDVTLNIVNCEPPKHWPGKIESNPKAKWVYKYKIESGRKGMKTYCLLYKKVNLSAISKFGQEDTSKKFEKAEKIIANSKKISKYIYENCLNAKDEATKEAALISFIIQETGIRIGNERDLDRFADTVGASTLKKENMIFKD